MTTSSDSSPDAREGVRRKEWENDTIAETQIDKEYGPDGSQKVYYYAIQDTSFQDAWLRSSESRNLQKMQ